MPRRRLASVFAVEPRIMRPFKLPAPNLRKAMADRDRRIVHGISAPERADISRVLIANEQFAMIGNHHRAALTALPQFPQGSRAEQIVTRGKAEIQQKAGRVERVTIKCSPKAKTSIQSLKASQPPRIARRALGDRFLLAKAPAVFSTGRTGFCKLPLRTVVPRQTSQREPAVSICERIGRT